MDLVLKEVSTRTDLVSFVRFPDKLYKGSRYYVPAIHKNQLSTLSEDQNPAFVHCKARYWLVYSGRVVVGRIAGIINRRYNQERGIKFMRFGWLDFVEDEEVLRLLLDAMEAWARQEGMEYVHGPLGFTSFDASGVLVEGFEELPTSWGRYNYPYYDPMLKKTGYTKDIDWVEQKIKVPSKKPKREIKVAQLVKKRYSLRNATFRNKNDIRKYAHQAFGLVNGAYSGLYGFSSLSKEQIEHLTDEFLPIIHPDFVSMVLNDSDEVVAFGLVMPSLSKALQKARGRLFPFGLLHILWALRYNDNIDMLLIGVSPEYQNKGAFTLVFEKVINTLYKRGIKEVETTRELEDNLKVQQLWAGYDMRLHKRARCYIKALQC